MTSHNMLGGHSSPVLPTIPWVYQKADPFTKWLWVTPHFVAVILSDGNKYLWNVSLKQVKNRDGEHEPLTDTSNSAEGSKDESGKIQPLGTQVWRKKKYPLRNVAEHNDLLSENDNPTYFWKEGNGRNFSDAERQIREVVGKSFHESLGYKKWGGELSYIFTISTGERVSFEPFVGQICEVIVAENDTVVSISGVFDVVNYDVIVTNQIEGKYRITPSHIISVSNSARNGLVEENITRVFPGKPAPGCTGKVGFKKDTVEHSGYKCPIHEE